MAMSMDAYLLPAYRDELEKRRGDARTQAGRQCALQSFAKHENALGQFRTQCFWSAMSLRIAFVFALGT
jgi:hypothetical protein